MLQFPPHTKFFSWSPNKTKLGVVFFFVFGFGGLFVCF